MPKRVYDLNRYKKTYPLIRRKPVYVELDDKVSEVSVLTFTAGQDEKVFTFQRQYIEVPICTVTVEGNTSTTARISSINTNSVTVSISVPPRVNNTISVHLQIISKPNS